MAGKKRQVNRGATPLVAKKQKREWRMPSWLSSIQWGWVITPMVVIALILSIRTAADHWVIKGVEVTGDMSVWSEKDVISQVEWVVGQGFFSADLNAVYDSVNNMPLMKNIIVRKNWPGYIRIKIEEDIPMAVWNGNKLVGIGGDLMAIPAHFDVSNLSHINTDIHYIDKAVKNFRLVQQTLGTMGVDVKELSVSNIGSVDLELSNHWHVELGRKAIEKRASRLQKIIERLPQAKIAGVDLRYGKGAAIQWLPEQEKG